MFVIKVFRGDEEPQIPPPFESRQTAGEWVRGNAWRAQYLADRVEIHEIDTTDRSAALELAKRNAGRLVSSESRSLTAEEQEHYDKERARSFMRDFIAKLKDAAAVKHHPSKRRI